jgi:GxxExxY protein
MHTDELRLNSLSERIIGCAMKVQNTLGCGFLEKVYENALAHELRRSGINTVQQRGIAVHYADIIVGDYAVDLLVEDTVIVELKAAKALDEIHYAQCLNYLKATGKKLCLLINFGTPRLQIKRIIL